MFDFAEKNVVLTGASQGIGAALANALAAEGANLCLMSRDDVAVHRVALEAKKKYGIDTLARACDIRDHNRVATVIDEAVRVFRRIDAVINNAAVLGEMATIDASDPMRWRNTVDVNLIGTFNVAHFTSAAMRRTGGGRMVIVSSSVGREPRRNWGAYSVSKYGCEGLMKIIAAESTETNIVCCTVNPGGTATRMRAEAFPEEDPATLPTAQQIAHGIIKIMREPDGSFNGRQFNVREYL